MCSTARNASKTLTCSFVMSTHNQHFDHIIIGAGSAGCALAATLARAGRRVALLESGKRDDNNPAILDASRWAELVGTEYDYDYRIEAQPRGNSNIRHTRGRMLGGTSSINTIIAWRTPDYDLERWVAAGASGWDPATLRPTFERLFAQVHLEQATTTGNPFHDDLIAACAKVGLPLVDFSPEASVQDGVGYLYFNKRAAMRESASVAFLHPLSQWGDELTIFTESSAEKILLDQHKRAYGVRTDRDGMTLTCDQDVVVCCGAFESPKLLLCSGIGPQAQLAAHGIAVRHHLAAVGENLLDHPDSVIAWESIRPIPQTELNGMGMAVFQTTQPDGVRPDVMCHVGLHVFDAHPKAYGYPTAAQGFSFAPNVARARSRGTVRLNSADASQKPSIDFHYFSDPYDEQILVEGINLARRIVAQSPLREWVKRELFPGEAVQGDRAISAYTRQVAGTVYHPAGTCKMGSAEDESAVVDPQLRVRGIDNLRVADASIFPTMIGVNPNMTIMMIGLRCAELILGA